MSQEGAISMQGASPPRRAPKRQRRRSERTSPRNVLVVAHQQQDPHSQGARMTLSSGVRTRSAAAMEQFHQSGQQRQQQQPVRHRRRAGRRLRQVPEVQPAQRPCEGPLEAPEPTGDPTGIAFRDGCRTDGSRHQDAREPREPETPARVALGQQSRGGMRAVDECEEPSAGSEGSLGPPHPSSCLPCCARPVRGSSPLGIPASALLSGHGYARVLEDGGDELLCFLSRARSALIEPLLGGTDFQVLTREPTCGPHAARAPGCYEPYREPTVRFGDFHRTLASLRLFSGGACLSQQYVAALSQEAAGASCIII